MTELQDLKKALEENKVTFGLERTMKGIKNNSLKNIVIASNCPKDIKEEFDHNISITKAKLHNLNKTNEEMGVLCKKPFSILVLGWQ